MRKLFAAAGSLIFFLAAPGVVAGLIPWWLTDWLSGSVPVAVRILGIGLLAAGLAGLVHSFVGFVVEGLGTPAPVAPTENLVVGGLYRYVRNPMYVAVLAVIVGQAFILGRVALFVYALVAGAAMAAFARWYEEPALARRFGKSYNDYRQNVPGWWPRLRPWEGDP